jgi:hypothetical protein
MPFGKPQTVACVDHLRFLTARIADLLPQILDKYPALRRRPFTFLGNKDFVEAISEEIGGLPNLISQFKIWPKYELDTKLVELKEGDPFIGIFLRVKTRWEVFAPLDALLEAGINLSGLYVIRREAVEGQRRSVGRIGSVCGGVVKLSEAYDDLREIDARDVRLEGSRRSFVHCLKTILGGDYSAFEEARCRHEAKLFTGPDRDQLLDRLGSYFSKNVPPLEIGGGLTASVSGRISVDNEDDFQSCLQAKVVEYCFDTAKTKRNEYSWQGIERFGPFSRDTFPKKSPKILVLFPDTVQGPVENFLRLFRDGVRISGGSRYEAGFAMIFGLMNPQFVLRRIPWLSTPARNPAKAYRLAAEEHLTEEETPDAAIVVVLDEHSRLPDVESPYIQSKAVLLMAGVPVQEIRVPTLSQLPKALQYVNQNVALSLYSKMNGTPWTVDQDLTINDELVIGMGTCELSGSRFTEKQRLIGITTVFRGDGNYLLSNVSKECPYGEYPEVLRRSTLDILEEIKTRNGWQPGDTVRIVFHVYKPLKHVEMADIMAECVRAMCGEQNVEFAFLTVSHDHPFTVLDKSHRGIKMPYGSGKKAVYVPERGTIIHIGRYTRLLCTNGPRLVKRENAPLPDPLLVHLHPRSTFKSLDYLTEQVLKFTSLSWRSTLPSRKPVTIYYSELIAELLGRLRAVPDWSPAMLNVKLRASRWFL